MLKFELIIGLVSVIMITFLAVTRATVIVKPLVIFKLRAYNTYIKFENETNFSEIKIFEDKVQFDDKWFRVKNGNITFKKFFENNTLTFLLHGMTSSQVEIHSPVRPISVKINNIRQEEGTVWSYNSTTRILKINYTFQ